ncbi:MAG: hypothetical protein F9B45_15380 [Phycisphaera sp. RhM]|nr:hypothetical protein [Phycisphaera sp. RhM]
MMQRITLSVCIVAAALLLTAPTVSAQIHDCGHHNHSHRGYGHYDHGFHGSEYGQGQFGYHHHLHHHGNDQLTYPVSPAAQFNASPMHTESLYSDGMIGRVYCPESGYCPSGSFYGGGCSATPYQPYPSPNLHGQSFDSQNHAGHDHVGHDHNGHSHTAPAQSSDNGYIPPPTLSQPSPRHSPSQPDLYPRTQENQPRPPSRDTQEQEAPIQMDGPPPTIT